MTPSRSVAATPRQRRPAPAPQYQHAASSQRSAGPTAYMRSLAAAAAAHSAAAKAAQAASQSRTRIPFATQHEHATAAPTAASHSRQYRSSTPSMEDVDPAFDGEPAYQEEPQWRPEPRQAADPARKYEDTSAHLPASRISQSQPPSSREQRDDIDDNPVENVPAAQRFSSKPVSAADFLRSSRGHITPSSEGEELPSKPRDYHIVLSSDAYTDVRRVSADEHDGSVAPSERPALPKYVPKPLATHTPSERARSNSISSSSSSLVHPFTLEDVAASRGATPMSGVWECFKQRSCVGRVYANSERLLVAL